MSSEEFILERYASIPTRVRREMRFLADRCRLVDGLTGTFIAEDHAAGRRVSSFLFRHGPTGPVVAFVYLFASSETEVELSAWVEPDYRGRRLFTRLLAEAASECRGRGIRDILLVCERGSVSGEAVARRLAAELSHVEYEMRWSPAAGSEPEAAEPGGGGSDAEAELWRNLDAAVRPNSTHAGAGSGSAADEWSDPGRIEMRPAGPGDREIVVDLRMRIFGESRESAERGADRALGFPEHEIRIATFEGKPVGMIGLHLDELGVLFLYAFGVVPELRGRGIGRLILDRTVRFCRERYLDPVAAEDGGESGAPRATGLGLEVGVENERALELYERCGFRPVNTYRYYRLPVDRAIPEES